MIALDQTSDEFARVRDELAKLRTSPRPGGPTMAALCYVVRNGAWDKWRKSLAPYATWRVVGWPDRPSGMPDYGYAFPGDGYWKCCRDVWRNRDHTAAKSHIANVFGVKVYALDKELPGARDIARVAFKLGGLDAIRGWA